MSEIKDKVARLNITVELEGEAAQVVLDEMAKALYNGNGKMTRQQALKKVLRWAFHEKNKS